MIQKEIYVAKERHRIILIYSFKILPHLLKLFVSKNVHNLITTPLNMKFHLKNNQMDRK